MSPEKIGAFIATRRKMLNMTQMQLAQQLSITDRAVSKWERGKGLPDASIMLELCRILGITVNDLLSGEVVIMDNYTEEMEKNLLEMTRQKQAADKQLLQLEIITGVLCIVILFALTIVASLVQMEEWLRITLILIGLVPLLLATPFMLRIEQTAGYYQCGVCGHRYVPTFKSVFNAPHMGRTRKMRCPECNQKSWQKKVLTKE